MSQHESNMLQYARKELAILEESCSSEDGSSLLMQKHANESVLDILKVLSSQEHSGGSIGYVLHLVNQCATFTNLTPLTGDDSEWMEICEGEYQNVRRAQVFKDKNGAYDLDQYVGVDPYGLTFTSKRLCRSISFPYTHETMYVPDPDYVLPLADEQTRQAVIEKAVFKTREEVMEFYASLPEDLPVNAPQTAPEQ